MLIGTPVQGTMPCLGRPFWINGQPKRRTVFQSIPDLLRREMKLTGE